MKFNVAIISIIAGVICASSSYATDPVGDFFRRLGNSISNAGKQNKHPAKPTPGKRRGSPSPAPYGAEPQESPVLVTPTPSPSAAPTSTPGVVRRGGAVPANETTRRDLPYGVPAPNKPGFVTSPYAPGQGLVDIRGIPPGTEVRDPFTGKIFLTP